MVPTMSDSRRARIRDILAAHAALSTDVATLSDEDDLFQAGMASFASVNVMLGLEAAFDIEFTDEMLTRDVSPERRLDRHRHRVADGLIEQEAGISVVKGVEDAFDAAVAHVADVAASHAEDVDASSRFPHEAVAAMKEGRLLSALLPTELGGMGATVPELAEAVRKIAFHCAATALVLAMHSIDVANLVRVGSTDRMQDLLREIGEAQLLSANANSEVGLGGNRA